MGAQYNEGLICVLVGLIEPDMDGVVLHVPRCHSSLPSPIQRRAPMSQLQRNSTRQLIYPSATDELRHVPFLLGFCVAFFYTVFRACFALLLPY
jgi:hypothetical protein